MAREMRLLPLWLRFAMASLHFVLATSKQIPVIKKYILHYVDVQVSKTAQSDSKANVFIKLYGENGQITRERQINPVDHYFSQNTAYSFTISALDVGQISQLGIRTDNKTEFKHKPKPPPGWTSTSLYYEFIRIEIPIKTTYYYFKDGLVTEEWVNHTVYNFSIKTTKASPSPLTSRTKKTPGTINIMSTTTATETNNSDSGYGTTTTVSILLVSLCICITLAVAVMSRPTKKRDSKDYTNAEEEGKTKTLKSFSKQTANVSFSNPNDIPLSNNTSEASPTANESLSTSPDSSVDAWYTSQ